MATKITAKRKRETPSTSDVKVEKKSTKKIKLEEEKENKEELWHDYELLSQLEAIEENRAKTIISLFKEEQTVPFLVRYRRDQIGRDMTAERLRDIKSAFQQIVTIKQRQQTVIRQLEKEKVLTDEVKHEILEAKSLDEVDHLYAPFKQHKGSLFDRAVKLGLKEAADSLLNGTAPQVDLGRHVQKGVEGRETLAKVEEGVKNILVHLLSKDTRVLEELKNLRFRHRITFSSTLCKTKAKEERPDDKKFELYFDFSNSVANLKPHQVLAINRGESLKILSVKIVAHENLKRDLHQFVTKQWFWFGLRYPDRTRLLELAFEEAYSKRIFPLLSRTVRSDLTKQAEVASIKVFATNLKQLLLTAPTKGEKILGIDPGFSNGCKMALISECGDLLDTRTIYPHTKSGEAKYRLWADELAGLLCGYKCCLIALGNGTACRETEAWLTRLMSERAIPSIRYAIVSEQGASIYSCSDTAQKEFPTLDVNLRSAVSIARRLNDPLCELVKVEPKNLGVGMYQHDINEKSLSETLAEVVSECVSFVGVDLNTASISLLRHVAGLSEKRAEIIVQHRAKNGTFKSREDLLKVNKIGPKTFTQCAGFVRIEPLTAGVEDDEYNLLDSTWVHPESYTLAAKIMKAAKVSPKEVGSEEFIRGMQDFTAKNDLKTLAGKFKEPEERVEVVLEALKRELRRDYRQDVDLKPLFKEGLRKMEDLNTGNVVSGAVTNVVDFGAFVDIGVEKDGLIHVSQMNGMRLKVGDRLEATVMNLDRGRGRIGLKLVKVLDKV